MQFGSSFSGAALTVALLVEALPGIAAPADRQLRKPAVVPCALSQSDKEWVDQSMAAWRLAASELTNARHAGPVTTILFGSDCILTSRTAMSGSDTAAWTATPHTGTVALPDGKSMPAGVTSFAGEHAGAPFFVMSTPSVWRSGGVPGGPMGLEKLMTAVLLHEGTHVSQFTSYMRQISELVEQHKLPDSFNDDSIQSRFKSNTNFSASVSRETDLLYAAAAAKDEHTARQLASQARDRIQARRAQFYTGADAYLARAEDVFFALEGSGQWVGYRWLTHPKGAAMSETEAVTGFGRRGGWWSQNEGLALILAAERIGGDFWRKQAFGDGTLAGLDLLDRALRKR